MKKRFLILALVVAVLVPAAFADVPGPAPYSLEVLTGQLSGLMFGARDNPAVAITHDQAQKLVLLLQQWQANLFLAPTEAKAVWTQAQAVLTPEQIAFKPVRPTRQPGAASPGSPRAGRPTANIGTGTYQDRQAQLLDRLVQRLQKL